MNTIYKKRRKFCFRDEYNIIRRFKTQQEAVAAAMGMSRDEMGDMLMNQEKLASIQSSC